MDCTYYNVNICPRGEASPTEIIAVIGLAVPS